MVEVQPDTSKLLHALAEDPYPVYEQMRQDGNVHRLDSTTWMLIGYDDVFRALLDADLGSAETSGRETERNRRFVSLIGEDYVNRRSLHKLDAPDHTRLRRLFSPAFKPSRIEPMRAMIEKFISDRLDSFSGRTLDVIAELGHALPFRVTCEIMGIPQSTDDLEEIVGWMEDILRLMDPIPAEADIKKAQSASASMADYLAETIVWKRNHLGEDLLSMIIQAGEPGGLLQPDEVGPQVFLVFAAGHTTTANLIGNSFYALAKEPAQWELLAQNPDLSTTATEELLRYDNSVQLAWRVTRADYTVGGETIPKGNHVICWIGAANRDPAHWGPTASKLDISRELAKENLSFGRGGHHCLGAPLARFELSSALRQAATRYPRLQLAEEPVQKRGIAHRGLKGLMMSFPS